MIEVNSFERLEVWQFAYKFSLEIYRLVSNFPNKEKYGLVDQLCRAAVSVPVNIAEGSGRGSIKDFQRFLYIARGSLEETKSHLLIAKGLGYVQEKEFETIMALAQRIGKMLNGLIKSNSKK